MTMANISSTRRETSSKHAPKLVYYRDAAKALKKLGAILGKSHTEAQDSVLKLIQVLLNRNRRIVLYLGAGCSIAVEVTTPEGYADFRGKSWIGLLRGLLATMSSDKRDDFLQSLARRSESETSDTAGMDIDDFLQYFDKLQVAWYLSSLFPNNTKRDEEISKLVEPPVEAKASSPLHRELFKLPFQDIITTNYDSHIARFLQEPDEDRGEKISFQEITTSKDLVSFKSESGRRRLFYLHGKARQSRLVFDRFDYAGLLAERDGILDYVTYLLMDSHVIYVGFGLDDPTFNMMETRLQTLHGIYRPQSFAFIPVATEIERSAWRNRNLDIIDYGDHNNLPEVLKCVNTTLKFVGWAEPGRLEELDVDPKTDRTKTYMAAALDRYVRGKYKESLLKCRAALASTLFWERQGSGNSKDTPILRFSDAARLCDIRIRMASIHYKLHWTPDENEDHAKALKENENVASNILKEQRALLKAGLDPSEGIAANKNTDAGHRRRSHADQLRTLRALENSLNILKARVLYHKGQFGRAQRIYERVVKNGQLEIPGKKSVQTPVSSSVGESEAQQKKIQEERQHRVLWKLRFAEGHFYAKCQLSRIAYQFKRQALEKGSTDRIREIRLLDELRKEIQRTRKFIAASEAECRTIPELDYYLNSLGILERIAVWTEGRHAVGVCRDVIPTRRERRQEVHQKLTTGLELLQEDPVETEKITWEMSQRWFALRYRYLCRGYALRWVVMESGSDQAQSDSDLFNAYKYIQMALQVAAGSGLERERIVNLLEAARLNVLAMFGERLASAIRRKSTSISPLSFGAGLHYLDAAFCEMDRMKKRQEVEWLLILGHRIASYFAIVSGPERVAEFERVQDNKTLHKFLTMSLEKMRNMVATEYAQFGKKLGNPTVFNKRIEYYKQSFDEIRTELGAKNRRLGEKIDSKNKLRQRGKHNV
jgi:SIR2-like protein